MIKYISKFNLSQDPEQLERSLTEFHFLEIQDIWRKETAGFPSVRPSSETPEFETLHSPSAKPIAYDLCFIHFVNARWKFPIEAKVLSSHGALAEYLKDVRDKFISGRAAPLVGEAGMIGYLCSGTPDQVFANLEEELKQVLGKVEEFASRPHRTSRHIRVSTPELRLHHMIMPLV
jgi:hypothetical protein